ncbi:MAG TPA: NAD/NADP octopine/nopaline dehydrogenase family protein, partial [Rectinemataceae bacterium]
DGLGHRYIAEDVPYGLLPAAEIGKQLGLSMKATSSLIDLAGLAAGKDFRAEGRSLASMGLAGLGAEGMKALAFGGAGSVSGANHGI